MADPLQPLPTRVGHAGWGDNRYCGHGVAAELAGSTTLWSLVSLAVGHRRLTAAESSILDDLATCAAAADPRIWPLKAIRLGAAWGRFTGGLSVGLLATDGIHGPGPVRACTELLSGIRDRLGDGDDRDLEEIVASLLVDPDRRLAGFGVAVREADERVVAFQRCLERRGLQDLPSWSLMRRVEAITIARRAAPVNISGATAAILLELGFAPSQTPPLFLMVLLPNMLANAHEGAAQAPAVLQRLPASAVRYVGAAPRKSPRAG